MENEKDIIIAKLKEENARLNSSLGEFYTLQEISRAITSILDINILLKYVNDIIIGVLGVTYSTIAIYDNEKQKIKIHTTNIIDKYEKVILNDNINCTALLEVLKSGKPLIENNVNDEKYIFTENRDIKALICVPLTTAAQKYGIILAEHKASKFYSNEFSESNLKYLDIIGQQVSKSVENARLYEQVQEASKRDGLTGLYNRTFFNQKLEEEFNLAKKSNNLLSLAIFDIDFFKKINDTYGHLFGDKVLKSISKVVASSIRKTDTVARFGGEEFVVLMPGLDIKETYEKMEILRKEIETIKVSYDNKIVSITVSIGVCCYNKNIENERMLLQLADNALYKAKSAGRNCVKMAE